MSTRMRIGWHAICLLVLATNSSCVKTSPNIKTTREAEMVRIHIDTLGLSIELPNGLAQYGSSDSPRFCFESEASTRYFRCFSIMASETCLKDDFTSWETAPIVDGGILYYQTEQMSGGSGGPVERLIGYATLSEHCFKVQAGDQGGEPDATWVVPVIQSLRYAAKQPWL